MTIEKLKKAIEDKTLVCPDCQNSITKFEKYQDLVDSIWDGAGDSVIRFGGCKVTLVCANGSCAWKKRTEYWQEYIKE